MSDTDYLKWSIDRLFALLKSEDDRWRSLEQKSARGSALLAVMVGSAANATALWGAHVPSCWVPADYILRGLVMFAALMTLLFAWRSHAVRTTLLPAARQFVADDVLSTTVGERLKGVARHLAKVVSDQTAVSNAKARCTNWTLRFSFATAGMFLTYWFFRSLI